MEVHPHALRWSDIGTVYKPETRHFTPLGNISFTLYHQGCISGNFKNKKYQFFDSCSFHIYGLSGKACSICHKFSNLEVLPRHIKQNVLATSFNQEHELITLILLLDSKRRASFLVNAQSNQDTYAVAKIALIAHQKGNGQNKNAFTLSVTQ